MTDRDVVRVELHEAARLEAGGVAGRLHLRQHGPHADDAVGPLDELRDFRVAEPAEVVADKVGMRLGECRFAEDRGHDGQILRLGQRHHRVPHAEPLHLCSHDHHRMPGGPQPGNDLRHRLRDRPGIGRHRFRSMFRVGHIDLPVDHVPRHLQVGGSRGAGEHGEHPLDLGRRSRRIVEDRRGRGDLREHVPLGLEGLDAVVEERLSAAERHLRAAAHDEHRRLLGVGQRDGIDHVQPAGSVGGDGHPEPADPRVGVGGEADRRLVRHHDGLKARPRLGRVEGKDEIPGDAERMFDPGRLDAPQDMVGQAFPWHRGPRIGWQVGSATAGNLQLSPRPPARAAPPARGTARPGRPPRSESCRARPGRRGS